MGLVDLAEKADTFDDMKAVSAALHAVLRAGRQRLALALRPAGVGWPSSAARSATASAWPRAPCPTAGTGAPLWAPTDAATTAAGGYLTVTTSVARRP